MVKLKDKRVLVTGGTRGIGYSIAESFVYSGAQVIVTGTGGKGKVPRDCIYRQADFIRVEQIERFAEEVKDLQPDILVNNAGINIISPFEEISTKDFELIHRVNVMAPFILCRTVIPHMKAQNWGRIVNISSIWGKISQEFRASYSSSKFAIDGMTAALSAELAHHNILANCVSPGFIDTDLTRRVLGDKGIAKLVANVPVKRLGTTEEIARFVVWLCSPENTFISGQNIAIDGGFTRV